MPTNNKTPNLNLNSWIGTDKPKRQDFVDDNNILDSVIANHIADTIAHMSANEKSLLNAPFIVDMLGGNGNSTCTHTLPFTPKLVILFLRDNLPIEHNTEGNYYIYNFAIATQSACGASRGATLTGNTLTLEQTQNTPEDGIFINLNKYFGQYVYIAFK